MDIRYDLLDRVLTRCEEVALEENANSSVVRVYNDKLKEPAEKFHLAQENLRKADSNWIKEHKEAEEALTAIDKPYKLTRAVLAAYIPHEVVPETLKNLTTDTDKINAIEELLDILELQKAQDWAAGELEGEFGTRARPVVAEISESIDSDKSLSSARENRALAASLTWERYLSFKRVVRIAYGSSSTQYRRIHYRSVQSKGENE